LYLRGDTAGYFHRARLQSAAQFIHIFFDTLEEGRQYPETTLKRIMELLYRWEAKKANGPALKPELLLEALDTAGLLEKAGEGLWTPLGAIGAEPQPERPVIALDTASSCILYPEIGFADALKLAFFCSVRETGTAVRFELTRESAVRGFDRNISSRQMLDLLEGLSGKKPDPSLAWNLTDWESRYSGVALHRGVVLTLSEDRRYLADAKPVAALISRTLAPGVYLLAAEEQAEAAEALQKAGVDIIARQEGPPAAAAEKAPGLRASPYLSPGGMGEAESFSDRMREYGETQKKPPGEKRAPLPDPQKAEVYKDRFRSALVKLPVPKPERDELTARIERRLILSESQLTGASIRFEKLEARGLDYVGKSAVAKQALASKSLLEICWPGSGETANRVMALPLALEKREGETILVLKPMPQGEELRLPLGKISLLRRIKHSIFGD
jgi:hypothetical protein